MFSSPKTVIAIMLIYLAQFSEAIFFPVTPSEWAQYKMTYNKVYSTSIISEMSAQYNYVHNRNLINTHNIQADMELRNYRLGINQFSDMSQIHINALFQLTKQPVISYDTPLPIVVNDAPSFYEPIRDQGLSITPVDQGTVCNSGWAYATAKAVELFWANQTSQISPVPLSAQNLIDCAGRMNACKNQVPQQGFDFLTTYGQDLHLEIDYPNNNAYNEPGMCLPADTKKIKLAKYSRILNGDDKTMEKLVAAGYPVVVEVNPTFEFIHYAGGLFEQPRFTLTSGSHFVTVVGYGYEPVTTFRPYWLVYNSFGANWGENGYMRIVRNAENPLAKSAIIPTELGPL